MSEHPPDLNNLVPHPRYGCLPDWARTEPPVLQRKEYAYRSEWIFPQTALNADLEKQSFSPVPRQRYFDVLKRCVDCQRGFVFFAREQKYWYEDLGFPLDADCIRCCECRRQDQTVRWRFQRYSELVSSGNVEPDDLATLVSDAVFLWEQGIIERPEKLRLLLSRAMKQIPDHAATVSLRTLVDKIREEER